MGGFCPDGTGTAPCSGGGHESQDHRLVWVGRDLKAPPVSLSTSTASLPACTYAHILTHGSATHTQDWGRCHYPIRHMGCDAQSCSSPWREAPHSCQTPQELFFWDMDCGTLQIQRAEAPPPDTLQGPSWFHPLQLGSPGVPVVS